MKTALPEAFVRRMREQLGNELSAFLHALDDVPVRGIRFNLLKKTEAADPLKTGERVPWEQNGYYLDADSSAGSMILHEAGAYYIQEPGAMMPAAVLAAKPGEKVLDLCAAPGGKTTQIGCTMQGEGILVCNEPVPKRASILSRNVERLGLPNAVVTCAKPEQLAEKWEEAFDAVLVDAPCSGEGMFRRDPDTRNEWMAEKAEGCAERQREILREAARLVRPGGRLVYSTCTYNPQENEENASWFTRQFPEFHPEAFTLQGIDAPDGIYTCYPHRVKGEGQFAALFRKEGNAETNIPSDQSLTVPSKNDKALFRQSFPELPEPTHILGNTFISMPELPDVKGIRILRAGLHLGEVKGKVAVPDHAAAVCFRRPDMAVKEMNAEEAARYMNGEIISSEETGWILMSYQGLVLGWGKGSAGMIKNHYPKGLRGPYYIP